MTKTSHMWKHPWVLGHRITLHSALKDAALNAGVELKLSSPIAEVDPETGIVVLKDGSTDSADVVVGADGVHSVTRKYVQGGDKKPYSSGKSAFRFLIPRQKVLDDPQTEKYASEDGNLLMVMHSDRRMVMYPTSNNTLLNFVCIHPEAETAADSSGDWNNEATRDMLLKVFKDYHEDFRAILAKADKESLKLWRLLDMVRSMPFSKS
jgi:2-polyprenyl-6-methoxyphenol hydroxylase-like FAD-dependent oxidoreductase